MRNYRLRINGAEYPDLVPTPKQPPGQPDDLDRILVARALALLYGLGFGIGAATLEVLLFGAWWHALACLIIGPGGCLLSVEWRRPR